MRTLAAEAAYLIVLDLVALWAVLRRPLLRGWVAITGVDRLRRVGLLTPYDEEWLRRRGLP